MTIFPLDIRIKFEKYVYHYQKNGHNTFFTDRRSTSADEIQNTSTANLPEPFFDLNQILTRSSQGSMIIDFYLKHKTLNESCRSILVELVINDLIKRNCTMTIHLANNIYSTLHWVGNTLSSSFSHLIISPILRSSTFYYCYPHTYFIQL